MLTLEGQWRAWQLWLYCSELDMFDYSRAKIQASNIILGELRLGLKVEEYLELCEKFTIKVFGENI